VNLCWSFESYSRHFRLLSTFFLRFGSFPPFSAVCSPTSTLQYVRRCQVYRVRQLFILEIIVFSCRGRHRFIIDVRRRMSDFPFYFVAAPRQVAAVARRVCAERSFPFVGVVSFLLDAADAVASEFSRLSTPRRAEVRRRRRVAFQLYSSFDVL
jgi:hypothetical protein